MLNLSMNPSITLEFIEKYSNWEWDIKHIQKREIEKNKFCEETYIKFLGTRDIWKYNEWPLNKENLSRNPNLDLEFVEKYFKLWEWDIGYLSSNPSITPEFIEKHSECNWNVTYLSSNPSITPEFIEKHLDWKWNAFWLSNNPNITPDFVEKYKNRFVWSIILFSGNPNITPDFIEKHSKAWDMDRLSENPAISLSFIEKNYKQGLNLKWNVDFLIKNPNITPEFIEKHCEGQGLDLKWNTSELTFNSFKNSIKEDENNHKNKIILLIGEEDKNSSLYNFKNNFLFDRNLNKLIFNFLCY